LARVAPTRCVTLGFPYGLRNGRIMIRITLRRLSLLTSVLICTTPRRLTLLASFLCCDVRCKLR
tara:strand:+ start:460 stop:651 length:192 start_codon:yes stop_codon:yes gene_type:complete